MKPDGNLCKRRKLQKEDEKSLEFYKDIPIDWLNVSTNQALNAIRLAVKEIIQFAGLRQCPCAIECLDFSAKKANLRYEHPQYARMLSGFAYSKLATELKTAAAHVGVEVFHVNPAWSSILGFVKIGQCNGLHADASAAAMIARYALPSRKTTRQMNVAKQVVLYKREEGCPVWVLQGLNAHKKTQGKSGSGQSTAGSTSEKALSRLSSVLGRRKEWGLQLKKLRQKNHSAEAPASSSVGQKADPQRIGVG